MKCHPWCSPDSCGALACDVGSQRCVCADSEQCPEVWRAAALPPGLHEVPPLVLAGQLRRAGVRRGQPALRLRGQRAVPGGVARGRTATSPGLHEVPPLVLAGQLRRAGVRRGQPALRLRGQRAVPGVVARGRTATWTP